MKRFGKNYIQFSTEKTKTLSYSYTHSYLVKTVSAAVK